MNKTISWVSLGRRATNDLIPKTQEKYFHKGEKHINIFHVFTRTQKQTAAENQIYLRNNEEIAPCINLLRERLIVSVLKTLTRFTAIEFKCETWKKSRGHYAL